MAQNRKPINELTDRELDIRIVFGHLEGIANNADRMTSGNFMHNRASIKLSTELIKQALNRLGIVEV